MRCIVLLFLIGFLLTSCFEVQESITAKELLQKTISFHDSQGKWRNFKGTLLLSHGTDTITKSEITIDLPNNYFCYKSFKEGRVIEQIVDKQDAYFKIDNERNKGEDALIKKNYLSAEQSKFWKNFFLYLYGLPMKLTDEAAIIDKKVYKEQFNSKQYLVIKVSYSPEVGKETWYFYINPVTFAMEGYKFYHNQSQNDGEYIYLDQLIEFEGLKIPKNRSWFMNKDNKQVGKDVLDKIVK